MDGASTSWADALAEEIQASYPGVRLQLGVDRGPYLVLFWMLVPESERQKGLGTRVMEHLIAAADLRGVPMTLSPSDAFGGDLDRLHAFYRRLGFITNTRRGEIGALKESMVRISPNTTAAALTALIARRTSLPAEA
ncbi:GNAT family N-acetyltransferase [Streptomyces scabiei]|uniref:GNAT family N-acetyltransferase n=1 Tax=Streptomyces scabiei TaxID=1930 RepID=UPI0029901599|nr:GNAT family N-acetyltransferase [Streptomyces scabiei]MDW8805498.1 GNAT family N-acetyltransferase [Streptomyces scabiei]